MNVGKFAGAAIGGAAVMILLGGLWHMLLADSFYEANSVAALLEAPRMQFVILGYLILGLLMA